MMRRMGEGERRPPELTRREREVVIELCRPSIADTGLAFTEPATVREIAERLFVSEAAVKQHLLRLYDKFEIPDGVDQRRLRLANEALARGAVTRADLGAAPPLPPPLWPETPPAAEAPAGSEPSESESPSMTEARRAFARRDWPAAYAELKALDATGALRTGDDLAMLGDAALWCGQFQESIDVRLRAHTAHIEAGAAARAALVALGLIFNYAVRMKMSVAAGWLAKARRHVEPLPEGREHGHLAAYEAIFLLGQGQADAGYDRASKALEIGRRHGDRDVEALGLVLQGGAFALRGRSVDAMALFDEAMASAVGGELGPAATGLVYCRTMCACLDLFEYRRAFEWTEVVRECGETADNGGFHGCRAHRAAVLAVRGESMAAEAEALTAGAESDSFDVMHTGLASYSLGRTSSVPQPSPAFRCCSWLAAIPPVQRPPSGRRWTRRRVRFCFGRGCCLRGWRSRSRRASPSWRAQLRASFKASRQRWESALCKLRRSTPRARSPSPTAISTRRWRTCARATDSGSRSTPPTRQRAPASIVAGPCTNAAIVRAPALSSTPLALASSGLAPARMPGGRASSSRTDVTLR
jgi:hypothetical protein